MGFFNSVPVFKVLKAPHLHVPFLNLRKGKLGTPLRSLVTPMPLDPSSLPTSLLLHLPTLPPSGNSFPGVINVPLSQNPVTRATIPGSDLGLIEMQLQSPRPTSGQLLSEWAVFGNSGVYCTKWIMVIMYLWLSLCSSLIVWLHCCFLKNYFSPWTTQQKLEIGAIGQVSF